MTITHNAKGSPLKIKVLGTAILEPIMKIDPSPLTGLKFEGVDIGSSIQKPIMIYNYSNSPSTIVISSIDVRGPRGIDVERQDYLSFPNNKLPIIIPPGSYNEIIVQFSPTTTTNLYNHAIKFIYNVNYSMIIGVSGYSK